VKSRGSTVEPHRKLSSLSIGGESGIPSVAVKCVDIRRNAEARKRGEQTGLDTLVVHAVNDGY
jgi:hypothetical protein